MYVHIQMQYIYTGLKIGAYTQFFHTSVVMSFESNAFLMSAWSAFDQCKQGWRHACDTKHVTSF